MADHFFRKGLLYCETIARLNTYKGVAISVGVQRPVEPGSVITVGDEKSLTSYTETDRVALTRLRSHQSWWRWFKSTGRRNYGEIVDVPF